MIKIRNHFEKKTTTVFMYNGIKVIANGCQCFPESELDEICMEFDVSETQKEKVLNALNDVTESSLDDITLLIKKYPLHISEIFSTDYELCKLAVQTDGNVLQFIHNQTEEICKLAVQDDGWALMYVHNQTEEICKLAVQNDELALEFVNHEFKHLFE